MERSVLHINICHFHAAIACMQSPRLRGYPLAIRVPGSRRMLLGVSSEAWEAGVCSGMTFEAAKRKCSDLVLLDPVPSIYERIDKTLYDKACGHSPLVERAGPGHLFIDLTGTQRLLGKSSDVGDRILKDICDNFGVKPAVGISVNRLVSKIATRFVKPDGLIMVIPGTEEEFITPLPITFLPGIDGHLLEQLRQFNLRRIGDITGIPAVKLASVIGAAAAYAIHDLSRGIDPTPVRQSVDPAPSVEESVVLAEPTNDDAFLDRALFRLISQACSKMRSRGLATGKVRILIRYADGASAEKNAVIHPPLNGDLGLYSKCREMLRKIVTRRVRCTEILLWCTELSFPYGQTDLFAQVDREEPLMAALDTIRASHGSESICFWGRERAA